MVISESFEHKPLLTNKSIRVYLQEIVIHLELFWELMGNGGLQKLEKIIPMLAFKVKRNNAIRNRWVKGANDGRDINITCHKKVMTVSMMTVSTRRRRRNMTDKECCIWELKACIHIGTLPLSLPHSPWPDNEPSTVGWIVAHNGFAYHCVPHSWLPIYYLVNKFSYYANIRY